MFDNLIPLIKRYIPDWNLRPRSELDAESFCEEYGIIRHDTDLITDLGEYRQRQGRPVILLQKYISNRYRNVVLHHEIGHFICHPTIVARFSDEVLKRKVEKEANFVAAVSLLPNYIMRTKTLAEIADEFNVPHKTILFRRYIYDATQGET